MLYVILLVCFAAIILGFLMIYVPLKEGYRKADERAQSSVATSHRSPARNRYRSSFS